MKKFTVAKLLTLAALFGFQPAEAIVSNAKMRVFKDFFQGLLQHNMQNFFARTASEDLHDIAIPELKSTLSDIQITL